jgi:hypothetical protein
LYGLERDGAAVREECAQNLTRFGGLIYDQHSGRARQSKTSVFASPLRRQSSRARAWLGGGGYPVARRVSISLLVVSGQLQRDDSMGQEAIHQQAQRTDDASILTTDNGPLTTNNPAKILAFTSGKLLATIRPAFQDQDPAGCGPLVGRSHLAK